MLETERATLGTVLVKRVQILCAERKGSISDPASCVVSHSEPLFEDDDLPRYESAAERLAHTTYEPLLKLTKRIYRDAI